MYFDFKSSSTKGLTQLSDLSILYHRGALLPLERTVSYAVTPGRFKPLHDDEDRKKILVASHWQACRLLYAHEIQWAAAAQLGSLPTIDPEA